MVDCITPAERAAIEAFPAANVQKIPVGKSGLYDEFGEPIRRPNPLTERRQRATDARIKLIAELRAKGLDKARVAEVFGITTQSVHQFSVRWGIQW